MRADDFGCVPDGRILDGVTITAGSRTLSVEGGGLRASDVGKSIAIPGAADLVATIGLAEHREVRDATISLDEPRVLHGTLIDPAKPDANQEEDFSPGVHKGRRITVAGAGPNGELLVTDVEAVLTTTSIRLADAASTAVAPEDEAEVILNDPDRVALSNYARRSVPVVTVDLGDRTIDDGAMTIGGRGLRSPTARFSSRDRLKEVRIEAAGLFVTTIESVESANEATLAEPAQRNVSDPIAADVWRTDSRPGLELLLAGLAGQHVEAVEICFSPGVYDFTRTPAGGGKLDAAISLKGLTGVTLRGSGPGVTVLRLMPAQDLNTDTHLIETADCSRLTVTQLSLHGAYLTLGNAVEQMHGINLNQGSEEVALRDVRVFQTAGDGIRLVGRPGNEVRDVSVEGCRLIQNKRSGIGFQRGVERVWVRGCYIEMTAPSTDQCIDFEPSAFGDQIAAPTDVIIESNVLVHGVRGSAVAITGFSGADPIRRVRFAGNTVLGGGVFCTDVTELLIQDNTILALDETQPARVLINVQRGGDSVLITGNLLVSVGEEAPAVISLSEVNDRRVTRTRVAGNLCSTRSGAGIRVASSLDVDVDGNLVVATGPCTHGVVVHAETSDVDRVAVHDNRITADEGGSWSSGIVFVAPSPLPPPAPPREIHHVSAMGNAFFRADVGVRFTGPSFAETPVCSLNRSEGEVGRPLAGLERLPEDAVVVGGAGAVRTLVGLGDPDERVTGAVGDVYQRIDGAPGQTLYVKESGQDTNVGWKAK